MHLDFLIFKDSLFERLRRPRLTSLIFEEVRIYILYIIYIVYIIYLQQRSFCFGQYVLCHRGCVEMGYPFFTYSEPFIWFEVPLGKKLFYNHNSPSENCLRL